MASTYGDGNGEARMMDFIPLSRSVFKTKMREISPDEEMSISPPQISPGRDDDFNAVSDSSVSDTATTATRRDVDNPLDSKILLKVVYEYIKLPY